MFKHYRLPLSQMRTVGNEQLEFVRIQIANIYIEICLFSHCQQIERNANIDARNERTLKDYQGGLENLL